MKIIIAGGGTGGHIFPAVAIANACQRMFAGTEVLFIGALGRMEMEKVPQAGFKIIGLNIAGFNRRNLLKNISLPFKIWSSKSKAKAILKDFKPDLVIGVGGYASYPMLSAAQDVGISTLIQEQNSFAGKSNKLLGKKAAKICVAYDNMQQFFPAEKIVKTGNPVRAIIAKSTVTKMDGLAAFDLKMTKPTLLIVGGSLGALSINEAIAGSLKVLVDEGFQIVWQTGEPFFKEAAEMAAKVSEDVKVHAFIKNMEFAYAAADFVISRAGALAIAELCIVAKPVIFVPYPLAAEDHQTSNAMSLVEKGAAWIVKDQEVQSNLVPQLLKLKEDSKAAEKMQNQLKQIAIDDADERIANIINELIKTA